ncbi:MAG: UbiD family decarboxylase [Deltaproteobacteria bacterium]|jgi:2,5-furandicarboxylate decarboxylase 1|nr:UbiD family decarboxylase [Deltaproteobacteria bacterium]
MSQQMLRAVLDRLRENHQLLVCPQEVDPRFELGAVLSHFDNERPILFTKVLGGRIPVAGALYGNRAIFCDLLGTGVGGRNAKLMGAIARPQKPVEVAKGRVTENVVTRDIDIRKMFPVPTSNGKDSAPYITAGMLVYRDIESQATHMAVRRFQVNRGNSINVLVSGASPHLLAMLERCRKTRRVLECAVVLGYDAFFLVASQISSGKYGLDKYEVDSALRGEPLQLTKAHGVDLLVPAQAEIVLEGFIRPGNIGPEGPFAELMGYYSEAGTSPLMDVTAVCHRNDPIFQHAFPCREEHLAYGLIKEAEIYAALSTVVDVVDVNLTLGGGCRLHAVVSIKKRRQGDGKSAILTVLGTYKDIKHVVVVDDDVDIFEPKDVAFALASRFQASRDLVVIPGALGSPLEASHQERGQTDKLGFDATINLTASSGLYERSVIPGFEGKIDISKYKLIDAQ